VEILGLESAGKSSMAIHAIVSVQQSGGIAAIIDAEHAFDRDYAEKLSVDTKKLYISQPDNGEQALEIAQHLISSKEIALVVIDSVSALTPQAEIEGDFGDSKMGLQARLMSQGMRKLTAIVHKTNTTLMFINQLREKIGVMMGSPYVASGGNALKFYSSQRLDVRKVGQIKDGENIIGHMARVNVIKNKLAPPFKKIDVELIYGVGLSKEGEIIDLGIENGIIKKSGSWYSYGETKLGQGRETVRKLLKDNGELASEIENKIKNKTL